jgi:hypothetical protein
MATKTVRMSDDLKARAEWYAGYLGVDLNALMVIALNDYLFLRTRLDVDGVAPCGADGPERDSPSPTRARVDGASLDRGVHPEIPRNALCPCGSGKKYKRCCGQEQ